MDSFSQDIITQISHISYHMNTSIYINMCKWNTKNQRAISITKTWTVVKTTHPNARSHIFEKHKHKSHKNGHTYKHIGVTKTRFIPSFLQEKNKKPIIQWELVIGTWTRDKERREPIPLWCSNLDLLSKELLQTQVQHRKFNTKVDGQRSLWLRDWFHCLFFFFCGESLKCEELQLSFFSWRFFGQENVKEKRYWTCAER